MPSYQLLSYLSSMFFRAICNETVKQRRKNLTMGARSTKMGESQKFFPILQSEFSRGQERRAG